MGGKWTGCVPGARQAVQQCCTRLQSLSDGGCSGEAAAAVGAEGEQRLAADRLSACIVAEQKGKQKSQLVDECQTQG